MENFVIRRSDPPWITARFLILIRFDLLLEWQFVCYELTIQP